MVLLEDFNAHSLKWNLHYGERRDAARLKTLIEKHDLIQNNKPGVVTRPTCNSRISIIDLTFTTPNIRTLNACVIDEELSTPSNHEVVVCDLTQPVETVGGMVTSKEVKSWSIRTLSKDNRKEAAAIWHSTVAGRMRIRENSVEKEIEQEADWIEATLITSLDSHATLLRVTAQSKVWWTSEVEVKCKEYERIGRLY